MLVALKLFFAGTVEAFSLDLFGLRVVGHSDGLMEGLRIAARVLGAVSVVALIGFATAFTDVIAALGRLGMPRDFVEVLMFAYRYVFMLSEEAWVIYTAQRNRLGYAGPVSALRSFGTLSGALAIRAFDHAGQTATALRQRGYEGLLPVPEGGRMRRAEAAVAALFLTTMGVLWIIL
jgi:cobalt/nickel transport system permease protein